jgi:hypothetical protein
MNATKIVVYNTMGVFFRKSYPQALSHIFVIIALFRTFLMPLLNTQAGLRIK